MLLEAWSSRRQCRVRSHLPHRMALELALMRPTPCIQQVDQALQRMPIESSPVVLRADVPSAPSLVRPRRGHVGSPSSAVVITTTSQRLDPLLRLDSSSLRRLPQAHCSSSIPTLSRSSIHSLRQRVLQERPSPSMVVR